MSNDQVIVGGRELDAFLQTLSEKVERNILRSAIRSGASVYAKGVKDRIPVGPTSSENEQLYGGYEGALRDSVRVTGKAKGGTVSASVKVGGKTRRGAQVFYAHMVEFGTKPHIIKPAKKKLLFFGGQSVAEVSHPGMKAQPFMRPAFDGDAAAAIDAVGKQIRKRLTAEGINSPAPDSE